MTRKIRGNTTFHLLGDKRGEAKLVGETERQEDEAGNRNGITRSLFLGSPGMGSQIT